MSLKIRLGKSKSSSLGYRIVVCETRSKRDGEPIDILGTVEKFDKAKLKAWVEKGAIVSKSLREKIK